MASGYTTFQVGALSTADDNGIVTSATPTSGTAMTISGALASGGVANLVQPRRVLVTYGNELSARTMRITGTNENGNTIQETLTIPSGGSGSTYTTQDFLTVTQVYPAGGGWSAAVIVGTNGIGSSQWKIVDNFSNPVNWAISGVVSGTVTWEIEYTYSNVNSNQNSLGGAPITQNYAAGNFPAVPTTFVHPVLNGITTNGDSTINDPIYAWRATITAGTGSVTITAIQAGGGVTR